MKELLNPDTPLLFKNPDYGKKVIIYDIETSYIVSATWGLRDISVAKVIREPFIIGIGWKYLGDKKTHYKDITHFPLYKKDRFNDRELILYFKKIIEEGEVFVAHNGNSFDWKWIMGRFAIHRIDPPPQKKHIDTLAICRQKFRFPSNSLKDLLRIFKLGAKIQNDGIELWYDCIELNIKARWEEMGRYCIGDVVGLEKLYLHIRGFITNHPNMNIILGGVFNCPNCGSQHATKEGVRTTNMAVYQRYNCKNCGAWSQGERIQNEKPLK